MTRLTIISQAVAVCCKIALFNVLNLRFHLLDLKEVLPLQNIIDTQYKVNKVTVVTRRKRSNWSRRRLVSMYVVKSE